MNCDSIPRKKQKLSSEPKGLPPMFFLNRKGIGALISSRDNTPLCYEDITNFILHASTPSTVQRKPYWCDLYRLSELYCLGVVVVENISLSDLLDCKKGVPNDDNSKRNGSRSHCLQNLHSISQAAVEVTTPSKESLLECITELYQVFSTEVKITAGIDNSQCVGFYTGDGVLREHIQQLLKIEDRFDRRKLLLGLNQLEQMQYPLNKEGSKCFGDVDLRNSRSFYHEVKPTSPMYAVDCEMVETDENPMELAQISIVDENLKVLYSTIVKPARNIINYVTRYSGLAEKDFIGVQTRLKDVQMILSLLLPPDAILIGHSLNSDLLALKISHPYCIDTSLIYNLAPFRRQRPSLKNATQAFFGVQIQTTMRVGHDPTEDAIAAMLLVKNKLANGLDFGDTSHGWKNGKSYRPWIPVQPIINSTAPKQSIFEIISKGSPKPTVIYRPETKHEIFDNANVRASVIDDNDNEAILNTIKKLSCTEKVVISHLKIENKSKSLRKKLKILDDQLKNLYEDLPLQFMLLVFFTGVSSVKEGTSNGCAFVALKNA